MSHCQKLLDQLRTALATADVDEERRIGLLMDATAMQLQFDKEGDSRRLACKLSSLLVLLD